VLSAGPTPIIRLEDWRFELSERLAEPRSWTWEEFRALPTEAVTADIHCETKWSKVDTAWTGVSIDTLLRDVDTDARFVLALPRWAIRSFTLQSGSR
jgi:DMSO/TMAO reductase YedYZ molybdopterin-dependent catalytic subunit